MTLSSINVIFGEPKAAETRQAIEERGIELVSDRLSD
jgi:hypothetical protein